MNPTMAFDIPYDQIRELQILLRKEAGLSSYNPEDPQLPNLPSLQVAISELDPSPSYLRCKHCNGRLLRGINSAICVFCGRQQSKDVPSDPIKFTSTFGYRWFLQSLNLDGSELVAPSMGANESNRGQRSPEIEVPLSDLLDLEIRWPSEPEKFEISVRGKTPAVLSSTANLAGVDLGNFFTEAKVDSVSASTEEQFALNNHDSAMGSNAFGGLGNLSLFENVEPSETVAASSKQDVSGDSFSGWEADFQSAGSATEQQAPELSDPFVGSSSVDLSSHMDADFGPAKDLSDVNMKENLTSQTSMNDWFESDLWNKLNAGAAFQDDQIEVNINDKDHRTVGNTNNSLSMNIDWIEDNQWQTAASSSNAADNRIIDEDDDSFDAWNDFTSSAIAQVPSSNSVKQDVSNMVPSVEQASESFISGPNTSKDADFDSFSQPAFSSATFNNQNDSAELNTMRAESSVSYSITGRDDENAEEVEKNERISKENTNSKAGDVETLMSQMHDLSFMLENKLSVPQKRDLQKIDHFSSISKD